MNVLLHPLLFSKKKKLLQRMLIPARIFTHEKVIFITGTEAKTLTQFKNLPHPV